MVVRVINAPAPRGRGQGGGGGGRKPVKQAPPSPAIPRKGGGSLFYDALGSHPKAIRAPAVTTSQPSESGRNTFQPSRINWS